MALLQATLASEIEAALNALTATPPPSPPDAVTAMAEAFGEYFKDAAFQGTTVLPTPVTDVAVPAMIAGMAFPDPSTNPTPAQGAGAFVNGYTAFWATIVAAPTTFWPAMTVCAAPIGLASLSSALQAQFAANNQQGITNAQAAANLAAAIHPNAGLTGTGMIGATGPFPIL